MQVFWESQEPIRKNRRNIIKTKNQKPSRSYKVAFNIYYARPCSISYLQGGLCFAWVLLAGLEISNNYRTPVVETPR